MNIDLSQPANSENPVRQRHPTLGVLIHSDQGVQYGSGDWRRFGREQGSMWWLSQRESKRKQDGICRAVG